MHLFPTSDVYLLGMREEEGRVVRCLLAKRKRESHPPQLRIVCRVYTYTTGRDRHTYRQEVRRDTYDITTGTWRMKPCTAYVMRGSARFVCSAAGHIFNSRFTPDYVFTIHLTAETPSFLEAAKLGWILESIIKQGGLYVAAFEIIAHASFYVCNRIHCTDLLIDRGDLT